MTRRTAASALTVVAAILLVGASVVGYAQHALLDSDQFADRATASLRDPVVRDVVGERVTDGLILRNEPDLQTARPLIVSAVAGIVGGGAFSGLFRRAALDAHRAVFQHDQDTVTLTLADVGTVAGAALETVRPELARTLEHERGIVVTRERIGTTTGDLVRLAHRVKVLAWLLAALTLACAAAAFWLAPDRREAVSRLGFGMAAAGVVIVVSCLAVREIVLAGVADPDDRAAAAAVWRAFLGDLRTLGWVLAGSGCVAAAAAASLIRPIELEARVAAAWRRATREPRTTAGRLARSGFLIAAGVLVIAQPLTVLQAAAIVAGVYVAYKGIEAALRAIYRPGEAPPPRRRRRRIAIVAALAAILVAGSAGAFVATGGTSAPAATAGRCNGSAALCDRPLDEVVLPATHNSMPAPLPGWFSSQQDAGIGPQLADGIRGLLIDTHYADRLPNGRVRTDFADESTIAQLKSQDGVSEASVEAALRLRERVGFRGEGERGMYLCHTFCELGSTPLADGLKEIHDFLVTHPGEVVVVINQDYVAPEDFVRAIGAAGLAPYTFAGSMDATLGAMIDAGTRLVVLAEHHAGAAPWYRLAYAKLTQETPFSFSSPAALTTAAKLPATCAPNRGPDDAPLFLLNHWVTTDPAPRPSNAAEVNAYGPLLARARECERIRHHVPNLIAVDFYRRGDLFRVVDTLNREVRLPPLGLGDPISYLTLSEGTPVFAAGGERIGVVEHVLADTNADVFDGLIVDGRAGTGGWGVVGPLAV